MNQIPRDRLYKLLPAIYQLRDAAEGEPLRALLAIIEQEVQAIEEDIGDLYDNWFIETCAEWVIPYMGDLLDVRELYASSFPTQPQNQLATTEEALLSDRPPHPRPYGQQERRAYVANTLAYRRRKGTTPILEQLVQDVTGWRARAVEFSRLLLTTQNLNHLRPVSATVDLRGNTPLELIGTPFEQQAAFTAELRQASQGGRYNIPNIGLFVWRLQSYPIERSTARIMSFSLKKDEPAGRFYTFNPLGYDDVPLFNQPRSETDITTQAQEINLPAPLRCTPLANELEERRQSRLQGKTLPSPRYFNESNPVLQIFVNGQPNPIPPEEVLICPLALTEEELEEATTDNQAEESQEQESIEDKPWHFPDADSERSQDDSALPTKVVAVDPELGRIVFLDRVLPERVEVSYLYGFSDDLGGGPYSRGATRTDLLKNASQKQVEASQEATGIDPLFWEVEQVTSADENPLDSAIQTWNRTVSAWQALRDQIQIPLARIAVPPVQVNQIKSDKIRPKFKPGIVGQGLDVLPGCCPTELLITPGLAIDRQGRRLQVWQIETVDLKNFNLSVYPNQIGQFILVIFYRAALQGQPYQFALVPETAIGDDGYPEGTFIPLARLKISSDNSDKRFIGQPDMSVRLEFYRGIIQGLEVRVRPGTLEAVITPGMAVDAKGSVFVAVKSEPLNLKGNQGTKVFIAISRTSPNGQQWQVDYLSSEVDASSNRYLCLAHLDIPDVKGIVVCTSRIVNGLDISYEVKDGNKKVSILVSAGEAKDCNNETIQLGAKKFPEDEEQDRLPNDNWLNQYQGQICSLVLCTGVDRTKGQRGNIKIVEPDEAFADFENYILLANLAVSDGHLDEPPISIYPAAQIVEGLEVSAANKAISITKGIAKDARGQEIKLEQDYQFDLSSYAARRLVLFISSQKRQGFLLEPIAPSNSSDWQYLGIVPWELPDLERARTGIILLKDSLTYEGDLKITIPQGKKLKIIATDGCRPHICGNVWVQGTAPAVEPNQGELLLDGLLIEGQLTVQPGNLKRLQVIHSTLVPEQGGLNVQQQEAPLPCAFDAEEPFAPIASVMTVFAFIQGLLRSQTRLERLPEKHLEQLIQLLMQQITRLIAEIWQVLCPWAPQINSSLDSQSAGGNSLLGCSSSGQDTNPQDNSRLEISLYHSICGLLELTETVPNLRIEDCFLDKGQARNGVEETSGLAIWAPGTDTEIFTTTVLGMSTVRSLEASNSLFTEKVTARLHQRGCIRFSHVPEGSQTPPRYQCQPDVAFKKALAPIPDAITSIVSHPRAIYQCLFSSSAGGGVFRSLSNGKTWEKTNKGLTNLYVSTVLVYAQPGIGKVIIDRTPVTGQSDSAGSLTTAFTKQLRPNDRLTIAGQTRTVTQILNDGQLTVDNNFNNPTGSSSTSSSTSYAFEINTVLAGTTGGRIFRSKNDGDDWVSLAISGITSTITVLLQYDWPLMGTLSEDNKKIEVNATLPEPKSWIGYTISVGEETRLIIDVLGEDQSSQTTDQTTTLTLNAPIDNSQNTITFHINTVLAATAGDGILRGNANGENWIPLDTGLTNLDIRALVVKSQGNPAQAQVFAGTAGDGVFQLIHGESGDGRGERWSPLNNNLKNCNTTALAIEPSGIMSVGTAGGGVFRFNEETGWIPVSQGLSSFDITALISCSITGTVASDKKDKKAVIGNKTFFLEEGLRPGDSLSISGQSGKIASIESNTHLTLETTLSSELPPRTSYKKYNLLISAMADGKLFRSIDEGDNWRQLSLDLKGLDFTALAANDNEQLFAGTAAGDIYCSDDGGDTWLSANTGLPNVIEKLLLMERLQPAFTSTRYGDPGYAQLSPSCARELRTGAEDGAEMGTFNGLKQPQREADLQANLDEYLRFGLESGIFYIT